MSRVQVWEGAAGDTEHSPFAAWSTNWAAFHPVAPAGRKEVLSVPAHTRVQRSTALATQTSAFAPVGSAAPVQVWSGEFQGCVHS